MNINTSSKGQIAVLKIQLECAKRNMTVCFPTTGDTRFDCIIHDGKKLYKTQIKYLTRKRTKSHNCLSLLLTPNGRPHYTKNQIDLLLVYVPFLDKILAFYSDIFHNRSTINVNLINKKAPTYYEKYIW